MSDTPRAVPYGSWASPIDPDLIVGESLSLAEPTLDSDAVYWLEGRPAESGRTVLVRRDAAGQTTDITPAPFNVRTRAHEYGGGAWTVQNGWVWFVDFADQCLYEIEPGSNPRRVTAPGGGRYADLTADTARNRIIAVCEDHNVPGEPRTSLVSIALATGEVAPLAAGADFYSSPRLSPDGGQLAWLSWHHPDMPWDATALWCARLDDTGAPNNPVQVAGGEDESVFQPEWSADGRLVFCSDRSGWWNLYVRENGQLRGLHETPAEYGLPQWLFGMRSYAFVGDDSLVAASTRNGVWRLERIALDDGTAIRIGLAHDSIDHVHAASGQAVLLAGAADTPLSVVRLDPATGATDTLVRASRTRVPAGVLSRPRALQFPTGCDESAHGLFYPPVNHRHVGRPGERPPLLVICHGGPTAATSSRLNLRIQFWTSRGIGVLDVNYRGSTGYGRAYRNRLRGEWGLADVEDAINGARHLVDQGLADPDRLIIRGGSAGGYTVLCALTFHDTFSAGASYYGVGDLEALMSDTHKFESRYGDRLLGPLPEAVAVYRARSPVRHAGRLRRPVIFFQGLDDRVVPPDQTRLMYEAIRAKGIPTACLEYEGEGHGFRRAETIVHTLQAELYFYGKVLGFEPADPLPGIPIDNLKP